MPNLSELTDYEIPAPEPVPANIPRVYVGSPGIEDRKEEKGIVQKVTDRLLGLNGEDRYQLWPEKVVREGLSAAGDVAAGKVPQWGVDPATGDVHTSPQMIEKAQAISALAGSGGLAGAEEGAVLNATPSLRPALKYKDKLYKGKPGQEHQDVIPDHLYSEFQDMAMKGEDISHYNFGFVNDKGHFLNREDALKYGIDSGLIDPQAGKFGALTSTLMADSSKPGTAIEAMAKADPFFSALEHNVSKIGQSKMTGDQWLGTLSNKPGVKPEELDWTGLKSFLQENGKASVTKEQIKQHLASNKVELKEVQKGEAAPEHIKAAKYAFKEFENYSEELANKYNLNPQQNLAMYSKMKNMDPAEVTKYTELQKNYIDTKKASETGDTKYHSYQLPGGENYREMLMTFPGEKDVSSLIAKRQTNDNRIEELRESMRGTSGSDAIRSEIRSLQLKNDILNGSIKDAKSETYRSSHWDEPNILAHVRMNDRTIDGKKSLHLEEIQSDWHQQGRDKGYKSPEKAAKAKAIMEEMAAIEKEKGGLSGGMKDARWKELDKELDKHQNDDLGVPDAPFKKTWHELALKRMLREAAEKGYDRLSWTPGEAQAARYDLSKSIGSLKATPIMDQHGLKYEIRATNPNGTSEVLNSVHTADELPNIVGKEMAKKIIDETEGKKPVNFKGLDLKVGGEGMKGFYDSIIPKAIEKLGKEHGVKVKQANLTDAPKYEMKNPILNKEGKEIISVYKDGTFMADMEKSEAKHYIETKQKSDKPATAHYIDIPQSLRDTAIGKGFPLFSSTHIFTPVSHDPFNEKKK